MRILQILLLLNLTGVACTFQKPKHSTAESSMINTPLCEPISFARIQQEILGTAQSSSGRCLACHQPGGPLLALDTYPAVKARLAQIEDSVRSQRMPKNGPLTNDLKQLLFSWIQQGAPEVASTTPLDCSNTANTPPPPTPTIEPHYESLRAAIFSSRCLSCHDDSGIMSSYDFSTYESIVSYKKLFRIDDDDDESRFVTSLVTGSMPRGSQPLPPEQIEVIRQWVALGLPETGVAMQQQLKQLFR